MKDTYHRQGESGMSTNRLTAVGAFVSHACKVFWLTVRPSSADWYVSLDDSLDGTGTTVWDVGSGGSNSAPAHVIFDPPIEFDTGCYLEAVDHIASCTIGYVEV